MIKRVLCLDVGEKRIGVAVSDDLGITAQGVGTIFTRGLKKDLDEIARLAQSYDTDRVVVGLPKSLSGEENYQAKRVREFASLLTDMQVRFYDERLTSVSANRVLLQGGVSRKKRRDVVDKLAATYILQAFLDAGGWR